MKKRLSENAEKTVDFIEKINAKSADANCPSIDNLQNCLNDLHAALPHFTTKK